jgi:hypothetical protein
MMTKLTQLAAATAIATSVLVAQPVQAHHSFAMFDMSRQLTLEGTVRSFQYTNPHIWINLTVIDSKTGQPVEWGIEGASPNTLSRTGWNHSIIKSGDKVKITIHPLRDGRPGGSLVSLQSGTLKVGI